jgi:hypothetical protein
VDGGREKGDQEVSGSGDVGMMADRGRGMRGVQVEIGGGEEEVGGGRTSKGV